MCVCMCFTPAGNDDRILIDTYNVTLFLNMSKDEDKMIVKCFYFPFRSVLLLVLLLVFLLFERNFLSNLKNNNFTTIFGINSMYKHRIHI